MGRLNYVEIHCYAPIHIKNTQLLCEWPHHPTLGHWKDRRISYTQIRALIWNHLNTSDLHVTYILGDTFKGRFLIKAEPGLSQRQNWR